jgi:TRAP-type C4-dicarboxylate transport system permease small subunit
MILHGSRSSCSHCAHHCVHVNALYCVLCIVCYTQVVRKLREEYATLQQPLTWESIGYVYYIIIYYFKLALSGTLRS